MGLGVGCAAALVAVAPHLLGGDAKLLWGQIGLLLRSSDKGRTWDDRTQFFRSPQRNLTPLESRLCEMEDGRLVAIAWAYDYATDRHHPNHVVVSGDGGRTWSDPINTGHMGQASNVLSPGGDLLLTIHAHRGEEVGLYVRVVDFSGNVWKLVEETVIWGGGSRRQTMADRQWWTCLLRFALGSHRSRASAQASIWPRTGASKRARAASGHTVCVYRESRSKFGKYGLWSVY
jgi:hypothetical protein